MITQKQLRNAEIKGYNQALKEFRQKIIDKGRGVSVTMLNEIVEGLRK